jgi:hypothetical protein
MFFGMQITDNRKWSIHTQCGVAPLQPHEAGPYDAPLRASCQVLSPPGMAIAPSATAGLSRRWCG